MPAKIQYDTIKNMKPEEVHEYLCKIEKPYIRDMKLKDLFNEDIWDRPILEMYFRDLSPRGVYMFFDAEDNVRYIGQTNNNFYQRILTQLDTHYYKGWGWNSMIVIMGCKRLQKPHAELCEEDHETDFEEVSAYKLLMIDVGKEDEMSGGELKWLEKTLMKTFREMEGDSKTRLLNNRIGWLKNEDWALSIDSIIR